MFLTRSDSSETALPQSHLSPRFLFPFTEDISTRLAALRIKYYCILVKKSVFFVTSTKCSSKDLQYTISTLYKPTRLELIDCNLILNLCFVLNFKFVTNIWMRLTTIIIKFVSSRNIWKKYNQNCNPVNKLDSSEFWTHIILAIISLNYRIHCSPKPRYPHEVSSVPHKAWTLTIF